MQCKVRVARLTVALWPVFFVGVAQGAAPLPGALEPWQGWVLQGQEFRNCPYLAARSPGDESAHRCAWPGELSLDLNAAGGTFRQNWLVQAESWIVLPGSVEHWPREVRLNGNAAAVVERDGVPQLRLAAGNHALSGRFAWSTRPESLPIAAQTALVSLSLDGRVIAQPERPGGAVWLGQRRAAVEREQLQLQVYRLLRDAIPARLHTRVRLQVSGAGREMLLGVALPAGFVPLSLTGELPARLEPDGRLRVQLRPGSFQLELEARGPAVAATVQRPVPNGPWAEEEIWSFEGIDRLRVAAVEGAEAIDPGQANVPDDWRELPAYRLIQGSELTVVERSRALANLDDNRLQLRREIWLDFNHDGFTTADTLSGELHRDWRLDLAPPYALESARIDGEQLLVTKGSDKNTGVELRNAQLNLSALGRLNVPRGRQPATGWSTRFENVSGTLHLPPGHRLLAVLGADNAPDSWVSRWGLWNLFGVLIVIVFTYWVAGSFTAVVAAGALALLYQELPELIWLWAIVLGAIAVYRAAPEGRLRRYASYLRIASFAALLLALVPLLLAQLRLALYPQLEAHSVTPASIVADVMAPDVVTRDAAAVAADGEPAVNAPPPAPRMELPDRERAEAALEQIEVTASKRLSNAGVTNRYASGTVLQAGPGMPNWHYNDYHYSWSGPVEPAQTVRFVYLGRWSLALWRVLGVALTALLALLLARVAFGFELRLPQRWQPLRRGSAATLTTWFTMLLFTALLTTPNAHAQALPTPELLNELKARLTAAPKCHPDCAEIMSASVNANGAQLAVTLNVSALTRIAIALPHAGDRWQLDNVTLDGRSSLVLAREGDGSLWLPLESGAHAVRLTGRLADAESVQLNFPQPPRAISVASQGWDASGVANGRLLSGSLDLARRRSSGSAAAQLAGSEFPAFVHVTRAFTLDLDWRLLTTVERVAPRTAPLQVQIPLITGESVLTPGLELREGRVLVGIARGQDATEWESALTRADALTLSMPADAARTEAWTFAISPQWHAEFAGLPASLPEDGGGPSWVYHYFPRAGESLSLNVTRPEAVAGKTLAIDGVNFNSRFGKRSLDGTLTLNYRSTQGMRHVITLPESLRVTQVTADGQPVPVRPEKGALALSLLPGEHSLDIQWTDARGARWRSAPDRIDLGTPASNVTTTLALPADRWPLFVFGRGVGTALLYWGELVVFLIIAWALGRVPLSPLQSWQWLLLGLGLSTLSWGVFVGVVVWLFALRWRESWQHATLARWPFNLVQLALAALTVGAVSSLVFSGIRYGLLASPDMSLAGPGAYSGAFEWFIDRTASTLPQPVVISVPIWIYRVLMFAWALWIALSLADWLRGAWRAWTAGGLWRNKVLSPAK